MMVRGKRDFLGSLVQRLGIVSLTLAARRRSAARTLTVVNYHRVDDLDAARDLDEGTLDATADVFDAQVAWLCRMFTLLSPADLGEHVRGRPWPSSPALITFDDGYRDNYERALPILERHGVKAFFFIATDFVARRRVFWWDRISYTLKHTTRSQFLITYPHTKAIDLAGGLEHPERQLHDMVKRSFGLDVDRFLSELGTAAEVPWSAELERGLADRLVMTWDHVRALRRAGMGIGSHTRRHRVLETLPQAELDDELVGSRTDLEAVLGEPVLAVAYPVGAPVSHLPRLRAAVEAAGYEIGFTYGAGVRPLRKFDPLDIGRIAVDRAWRGAHFRAAVTFPWLR